MKSSRLAAAILMFFAVSSVCAGTLVNANWVPSGCGVKPEAPLIDVSNADSYNKTITAINAWQLQAKTYYECLVKEANADNTVIADTANREQNAYRETVRKIAAAIEEGKKALESK